MNKLNHFKGNKKLLLLLIIPMVLLISLLSYNTSKNKQEVKAQEQIDSFVLKVNELESELFGLYTNDELDFIHQSVSADTIQLFEDEFNQLNEEMLSLDRYNENISVNKTITKMSNALSDITNKFKTQVSVNKLFQDDVLRGDKVDFELAIADGLTVKELDLLGVVQLDTGKQSNWLESVLALIDNAHKQVDHIANTEKLVNNFYFKDEVIENPDKESYEKLVNDVETIKNMKKKNELQSKMEIVLAKITENESLHSKLTEAAEEETENIEVTQSDSKITSNQKVESKPLAVSPERTGETEVKKQEQKEKETKATQKTETKQAYKKESKPSPKPAKEKEVGKTVYQGKDTITGGDVYGYEGPPISTLDELSKVDGIEIGNPPWEND